MTQDLTTKQEGAVQRHEPQSLLEAVMREIHNPEVSPERVKAFLEIGIQLEAREAKKQFDAALREMQPELPTIKKNGLISYGVNKGSTPFAKWDDVHRACMPILNKFGFTCVFTSDFIAPNATKVVMRVKHIGGHQEEGSLTLPWLDSGGSKSPAQQAASTLTLGERHVFVKFFNILTEDLDDDGSGKKAAERITDEQAMRIEDMLAACSERDPKLRAGFAKWIKAEHHADRVADLFQGEQLESVMARLREKMAGLGIK